MTNKLILDTEIEILYLRQTRVSSTERPISDSRIKKSLREQRKDEIEEHWIQNS